jgi:hypothetical protein
VRLEDKEWWLKYYLEQLAKRRARRDGLKKRAAPQ